MNKYSIKKEAITSFEIECNFGSIYIDTTDIELSMKVNKMYEQAEDGRKNFEREEKKLVALKLSEEEHNERKVDAMLDYVNSTYRAINSLFGDGATDKIFRVKSITALEQFLDDVLPLLQEFTDISNHKLNERIEARKGAYAPVEQIEDIEDLD